jgi:hypothetical protein
MDWNGDFTQLPFGVTSYEKNIKAFPQYDNPQFKVVPVFEKPRPMNYRSVCASRPNVYDDYGDLEEPRGLGPFTQAFEPCFTGAGCVQEETKT